MVSQYKNLAKNMLLLHTGSYPSIQAVLVEILQCSRFSFSELRYHTIQDTTILVDKPKIHIDTDVATHRPLFSSPIFTFYLQSLPHLSENSSATN